MIYSCESVSALEACEDARLYEYTDDEAEDEEYDLAALGLILRRYFEECQHTGRN